VVVFAAGDGFEVFGAGLFVAAEPLAAGGALAPGVAEDDGPAMRDGTTEPNSGGHDLLPDAAFGAAAV
jgi:hypothetical protein